MRITGLCGGIGAGKSTVAELFAEHGATIIDVDQLGREVIEPGGRAHAQVIAMFGERVVADDGETIDRTALTGIVFADPAELAKLESVSHPAINAELDARLAALDDVDWVVLDMAVLVESKLGQDLPSGRSYDTVVVVETPTDIRVERLVSSREMDPVDAANRIASQTDDETRRAVADVILTNDGDLEALRARVRSVLPALSDVPTSGRTTSE